MRLLPILALLAAPAFADTIEAPGPVTAVTLYPSGATVTRTVTFTAAAGTHQIVVPGVTSAMSAEGVRVSAPEGVVIGAVSLDEMRPPEKGGFKSVAILAAEAEVQRLEAVVRDKRREVAGIRAHAEAAEARVAFLQSLAKTKGEGNLTAVAIPDLQALAAMVDQEVLAARQTVLAVEEQATVAEIALQPDVEALEGAKAALEKLAAPKLDRPQVLTVNVETPSEGEVVLTVISQAYGADYAYWEPVYDLRLTRKPDALSMARGVKIQQRTGEDWQDIDLTLSTSKPLDDSQPSSVWEQLRSIKSQEELEREAKAGGGEPDVTVAEKLASNGFNTSMLGLVFTYQFRAPVTIGSDAGDVRLEMDEVSLGVRVFAAASPLGDSTAYLMADLTNTTGDPLLPGNMFLYVDGAMVGAVSIYEDVIADGVPPGGHAEIGFGPIPGLRLTRIEPHKTEGAEGVFTSANRQEETAIITVENLTDEAWPMRVTDRIPYSEQDDLAVTYGAAPPATEVSPEGRRGVLVWTFDLAPGAKQEIRLDTRLDWPDGWVLR